MGPCEPTNLNVFKFKQNYNKTNKWVKSHYNKIRTKIISFDMTTQDGK